MSKRNVKLVQGFYEATSTGDFGGASRVLDPQIEWIEPDVPGLWFSGTHRGPDAVFKEVIEPSYDKFDKFHLELEQLLDSGDQVVVTGTFRGRRKNAGTELNVPFVHIWKVDGGKLVRFQNYVDTASMLNALGGAPAAFADFSAETDQAVDAMNVQQFLKDRHAPFAAYSVPATPSAQHLAHSMHVPGKQVAKTVLLRVDEGYKYVVAVLPATHIIDFEQLATVFGGMQAVLACEADIAASCPDCENGALPPFGSRYGMETLVDQSLTEDEQIVFEGNTRCEAIQMRYSDFYNLEHPLVADFARRG